MAENTVEKSEGFSLGRYISETRGEVRKVVWPTREQAIRLTAIVLAATLAMTVLLYAFDYVFSKTLELIVDFFLNV